MSHQNDNELMHGLEANQTLFVPGLPDEDLAPIRPNLHELITNHAAQPSTTRTIITHAAVVRDSRQCISCGEVLQTKTALDRHGSYLHQPFACTCGQRFARSDNLSRHLKAENGEPDHHCPLCSKRRGQSAFYRADHLRQHLVEYHKCDPDEVVLDVAPSRRRSGFTFVPPCPALDCTHYRGHDFFLLPEEVQEQTRPFAKNADYHKHMRSVHNLSHFPCLVPGCDRIGAKGYFRENDLVRYHQSKHADTPLQVQTQISPDFYV
ncbi:hypothetical protein BGZ61DRAFT_533910 [Ilyonectria robusta]|uniref:uncharacterized protein n=1 Tax=Ilyonectria robusta TaxID=1079257 RepID=UPI001E8D1D1D|nr:uncharacterized protein BGZ61DRAFT_533910 [Ilyonectria robusta]KAH8686367.1 hypothetical protein BGZ61DRAFT_533910 [Ilyonectria robusta]